jgi:REP element-mobilizing transposase RayT
MSLYYHAYNRGTNKSNIVRDKFDLIRLEKSLYYFNTIDPIGSIYEEDLRRNSKKKNLEVRLPSKSSLLELDAYIINPNHYHLLVKVEKPESLSKYLQRLNTGYTKYFNNKYDRSGVLFQGKTKRDLIETDAKLNYLRGYILFNDVVHGLKSKALVKSSRFVKKYSSHILDEGKRLAKSVNKSRNETNYYVIEKFGSPTSK